MEIQKPTKKRLLTTLLSVAMAFTMLPTAAFAQEPATDDGGPVTTCICESKCMKDLVNKECEVCKNDFDKCGVTGKAAPPNRPPLPLCGRALTLCPLRRNIWR